MTFYRMKLTNYEIRTLIGIIYEHRQQLKQDGYPSKAVDEFLLKVLNFYEISKTPKCSK